MMVGQETPTRRASRRRDVKLAYVDQSRDALDAKKNVWEEISGGLDLMQVGGRTLQYAPTSPR